jgi:HprK-related kinase B
MSALSERLERIRAAYPATERFFLHLSDSIIEVTSNSPALNRELTAYFGSFARDWGQPDLVVTAHEVPAGDPVLALPFEFRTKAPEPGKAKIKEEWADVDGGRVVRKRLTGMVMAFGGGEHLVAGPCLENPNQVVNFLNNRYIERKLDQGAILGHAAAVALNGRGLALAGFSGMGKSTLALHAVSLGADFVSNDRILVQARTAHTSGVQTSGAQTSGAVALIHGVAKHPRINPGTALNNPDLARVVAEEDKARFLALPPAELWALEHKYDAIVEDCFGPGRFRLCAPFSGLVLLNWKRDGGPLRISRVDPEERRDLLPAVMKSPGLFYPEAELREIEELPEGAWIEALKGRVVLEFSGGVDFAAGAEACLAFLETGEVPGTGQKA